MDPIEQAFVEGMFKQAAAYGLSQEQAVQLLEKDASLQQLLSQVKGMAPGALPLGSVGNTMRFLGTQRNVLANRLKADRALRFGQGGVATGKGLSAVNGTASGISRSAAANYRDAVNTALPQTQAMTKGYVPTTSDAANTFVNLPGVGQLA